MKTICEPKMKVKIENSMDLLRGTSEIRLEAYYNFYKCNYELLIRKLKEKNKILVKIVN